jgi:murein L,D-transpeptidase YafK
MRSTLESGSGQVGRFVLLNTYPICKIWKAWPKDCQGDRQAPEGFYDITPDQMNLNSVNI